MGRKFRALKRRARAGGHRLMAEQLEERRLLAVFTVISFLDSGVGTLREAIELANQAVGADTVEFDAAIFSHKRTITLKSPLPAISETTDLQGPGINLLTVNGAGKFQIFLCDDQTAGKIQVTISDMTLTGGKTAGDGGAISNVEDLIVNDVAISKCTAGAKGAGSTARSGI